MRFHARRLAVALPLRRPHEPADLLGARDGLELERDGDAQGVLAEEGHLAERLEDMMLLGLRPEEIDERFHYLLNQNVRLDDYESRNKLFNEILDFQPSVVIIDSATRVSNLDENSASDMARLYHEALKPMSREFGCSVFLIDHLRKAGPNSRTNDQSIRGSTEKTAQVDRNWLLHELGPGAPDTFLLKHGKTRRGAPAPTIKVTRKTVDGALRHVFGGVI